MVFEAQTFSDTQGTMIWHGAILGPKVEGTVEWQKTPKSSPEDYWFRGEVAGQ